HVAARRPRRSYQLIGVDDRRAPAPEQLDDGRLAGGDIPGESYVEHGSNCGLRIADCGLKYHGSNPQSAIDNPQSEQSRLILILPRHPMTMSAPRLVRLPSPDHDGGAVPQRGLPVHEALIAARGVAAHHADGLELVDDLR